MIIVNFKTYKESSGENAVSLAHQICDVASGAGVEIISCPNSLDLKDVVGASDHSVWAQHADPVDVGRNTGWLSPKLIKLSGAKGTLLNHSEHKLSVGKLGETLMKCKDVGLVTLVFADSLEEALVVAKFKPDYIGYEPPELIASSTTSVAKAKPEIIEKVVKTITDIPIIVGAGVKGKMDVQVSKKLGAKGVALSSAVVLADNPKEILMDLAEGFK